jgi:hypothetical protein
LSQITLADRIAYNIDYALSDLFDVNWRLERDPLNNTVGPVFQSWQLQAFPAPTRIDEIVLPVVLKKRDDGDWWEGTMTVRLLTLP